MELLVAAAPYLLAGGMAAQMTSGVLSAQASIAAAKSTQRLSERNARLAENNAARKDKLESRERRRRLGRTRIWNPNLEMEGSKLGHVSGQAGENAYLSALTRAQGQEEAWGIRSRGRLQAANLRAHAFATILGTVGNVAMSGAQFGMYAGAGGVGSAANAVPGGPRYIGPGTYLGPGMMGT